MAHVLVIDDSAAERVQVQAILESLKHESSFVDSANAAMERLDGATDADAPPDALLVDVSIEGFDPVEFVGLVRKQNARVPIVLMSSRGHERSVIRALQKGASNYLPRDLLDQELPTTLKEVLAYSQEADCQFRLMKKMSKLQCQFELDADRSLIPPLVGFLQGHIERMQICGETDLVRVGIALDEALVNALQHGNLELDSELREQAAAYHALAEKRSREAPYADRKLTVLVNLTSERAEIIIQDEGPGFDVNSLPDPRDPANLEKVSGRGILLMRTFMDEVTFNDAGNQVTLRKYRDGAGDAE